jgi:hypothetical protein
LTEIGQAREDCLKEGEAAWSNELQEYVGEVLRRAAREATEEAQVRSVFFLLHLFSPVSAWAKLRENFGCPDLQEKVLHEKSLLQRQDLLGPRLFGKLIEVSPLYG